MAFRACSSLQGVSVILLLGILTGCLDRKLVAVKPCVTEGFVRSLQQNDVSNVDLLFVVDNSGSMDAEQTSLRRELPGLVETLATGRRSDGTVFTPVTDLHVAVVTTDLGAGFEGDAPGCTAQGQDAVMISEADAHCGTSPARYLSFRPDEHENLVEDAAALGEQFGCIAHVGIAGCGIEQQLDAALKALVPADDTRHVFLGNTHGHGNESNAGFLREDSIIAVILVTDEDDCSATPQGALSVYDNGDTTYGEHLNIRCQLHADEVTYGVERYVDGLRSLRPGAPERVVFGAITGVPQELVADPQHIDYDAILGDPRMVVVRDATSSSPQVVPACSGPGGSAAPARRIIETARRFGNNGIVQSICQDDFGPALSAIIDKISSLMDRICLPRALNPDANGLVDCDVIQRLPSFEEPSDGPVHCADAAGVEPTPVRIVGGREECRMLPVAVIDHVVQPGDGWYYDDFSDEVRSRCVLTPTAQRVTFTENAIPVFGAEVNLECLQHHQSTHDGANGIDIGTFCTPGASVDMCAASTIAGLFCEASTRSCQIGCASDEACPSSFLCLHPGDGAASYCVNPVCSDMSEVQ